jgi:hypothetical protein
LFLKIELTRELTFDYYLAKISLPRFDITNYLFYRRKRRRMYVRYVDCKKHIGEKCGVFVCSSAIVDQNNDLVHVPQFCKKDFDTEKEQWAHVYSTLAASYRVNLIGDQIKVHTVNDYEKIYAHWYREYYTPASQIRLNAMSRHTNNLALTNEQLADFVPLLTKKVDDMLYAYMGLVVREPVVGKPAIKSLEDMCKQRTSVNFILTQKVEIGGEDYPLWYYSTNSTKHNELKIVSLLREFSFDTTQRGTSYQRIRPYVSPAIAMLERKLNTSEYYGRFRYHYSPRTQISAVRFRTSGGCQNNESFTVFVDGVKYKIVNSGNKLFLFEAAARELHTIHFDFAHDVDPKFVPFNVTKLKPEPRYLFEKIFSKIPRALFRVREFFIPSLTLTLLSENVHKNRMLIERGEVIMIGCTPWYGGWYQLAVILNFDNIDIFWVDGDITALDKHLTDWQLMAYFAAGARYYCWSRMNRPQRRMLKRLYLFLMYHVTNKITLQPGNFWRLIRGVMYSGGKETSHGDSWIMALIFFIYVEHIKFMHPSSAAYIHQCLIMNFIVIIVYGDDHIWCAPKNIRHLINGASFARFLKEYLGMELRDFKEYDKFLTEVNIMTGIPSYMGPRFLKRHFIASYIPGSAPVLPFKFHLEPSVRMCTVLEHEGYPGLMLKAIGTAWDSLGTNLLTYNASLVAYQFATACCNLTPKQIYILWLGDPSKVKILQSMAKKANMKESEFFEAFPSLTMLQERHNFIPRLCNHRPEIFRLSDFF